MTNPHEALKATYQEPDFLVPDDTAEFALTGTAKTSRLKTFINDLKETHRYVTNRRSAISYH